jgi:hypothetical protein
VLGLISVPKRSGRTATTMVFVGTVGRRDLRAPGWPGSLALEPVLRQEDRGHAEHDGQHEHDDAAEPHGNVSTYSLRAPP